MGVLELKPVKFIMSVGGIYISYIYFGLIMERLFKYDYSGQDRPKGTYEKFSYGFATSIFQNLFSWIVATCVNRFVYNQEKSKMDVKSEITIAFCNFSSVNLASQSLLYTSFPVQALMKSSKIISILIVSFLIGSAANHTKSQYFCGFIITTGIVIFNLFQDTSKHASDQGTSWIGLLMITGSLFCDGFLGTKQSEVKKKYNPSSWDQMESLNKWAGLMCFAMATVTLQVPEFVGFILKYPAVVKDVVLLALLGTMGQVFIFYTIYAFSPLFLSIVTTTRKFFTVLASIAIYGHVLNIYQWCSIGLVFIGVTIEMLSGDKSKGHGHGAQPKDFEKLARDESQVVEKDTTIELVTKRALAGESKAD
jgi:UDP-galactose transporter B1